VKDNMEVEQVFRYKVKCSRCSKTVTLTEEPYSRDVYDDDYVCRKCLAKEPMPKREKEEDFSMYIYRVETWLSNTNQSSSKIYDIFEAGSEKFESEIAKYLGVNYTKTKKIIKDLIYYVFNDNQQEGLHTQVCIIRSIASIFWGTKPKVEGE
jgi:hypothetical protein